MAPKMTIVIISSCMHVKMLTRLHSNYFISACLKWDIQCVAFSTISWSGIGAACSKWVIYGLTCNKTQQKSTGNKTQMCTYRCTHLLLPVYSWTRWSTSWRGGSIGWAGGKTLGSTSWAGGSTSWEGGSTSCEGGSISWTGGEGGRLGGMVSSASKDLMMVGLYYKLIYLFI